jgi:hypothetical protein
MTAATTSITMRLRAPVFLGSPGRDDDCDDMSNGRPYNPRMLVQFQQGGPGSILLQRQGEPRKNCAICNGV